MRDISAARRITLVSNRTIFEEGAPAETAYVIDRGVVELFTRRDGVERVVGRLGSGEVLGEQALTGDARYAASARAIGHVTLSAVTEASVETLRSEVEPGSWATLSLAMMRMRDTRHALQDAFTPEPVLNAI